RRVVRSFALGAIGSSHDDMSSFFLVYEIGDLSGAHSLDLDAIHNDQFISQFQLSGSSTVHGDLLNDVLAKGESEYSVDLAQLDSPHRRRHQIALDDDEIGKHQDEDSNDDEKIAGHILVEERIEVLLIAVSGLCLWLSVLGLIFGNLHSKLRVLFLQSLILIS
ncbi:hypothetical protein PMAYCL1PPCAC_11502, partial [Pristionchus mayeri]